MTVGHPRTAVLLGTVVLALASLVPRTGAGALLSWLDGPAAHGPRALGLAAAPDELHDGLKLPVPMILGYYDNPGGDPSGLRSLVAYRHDLTGIVPFWYTIHRDGTVSGQPEAAVMRYAARHRLWVFALVQNMGGPQVYHQLLTDPLAEHTAIENLLALCQTNGYDGLNLDFEGIAPGDGRRYTAFVAQLGSVLHRYGYYLTLSVPAETRSEPANPWTGAYDYRALARSADLLLVMAYDQHNGESSPGSIAASAWVRRVLSYATTAVNPSRIVLGIPTYGYEWIQGQQGAVALTYDEAAALDDRYAGGNLSLSHFTYYHNGVAHEVFYENTRTFDRKIALAVSFNVRGIALWRLGIEDPSIWKQMGG